MATNVRTIYGPSRRVTGSATLHTYKGEPFAGVVLECGHTVPAFKVGQRTNDNRARCNRCLTDNPMNRSR